jgi:hypothetical protein
MWPASSRWAATPGLNHTQVASDGRMIDELKGFGRKLSGLREILSRYFSRRLRKTTRRIADVPTETHAQNFPNKSLQCVYIIM